MFCNPSDPNDPLFINYLKKNYCVFLIDFDGWDISQSPYLCLNFINAKF